MEPKKGLASTDPPKVKKPNLPDNEEMDAPHSIGKSLEETSITPEREDVAAKEKEQSENSSEQNKEISETLGLDDDELETDEEQIVN